MALFSRVKMFIRDEKLFTILLILFVPILIYYRGRIKDYVGYYSIESIEIIFSLMVASRLLVLSGLLERAMDVFWHGRGLLLYSPILLSFIVAPIATNDGSLFILIPYAMAVSRMTGLDVALLSFVTIASCNLASTLLPIGNPQDIIIWRYYRIGIGEYISYSTRLYALSMAFLLVYFTLFLRRRRERLRVLMPPPKLRIDYTKAILSLVALASVVISSEIGLPHIGLMVTIGLTLISAPRLFFKLDYTLLAIFALMFVDFGIISHIKMLEKLLGNLNPNLTYAASATLSQIISNVPAAITLLTHTQYWKQLFAGVNIGGTGIVTASMANIIGLRLSRTSYKKYHKYALTFMIPLFLIYYILASLP